MIVYFLNRGMLCLGMASTSLPRGYLIINDKQIDEIESGISSIEFDLLYSAKQGGDAYNLSAAGNYLLVKDGTRYGCLTILTAEGSTEDGKIAVYAENAGIDLLNEIVGPTQSIAKRPASAYIEPLLIDSGWGIGVNDLSGEKALKWDGENTVAERLLSIADGFNGEMSYSFDFSRLSTSGKKVNFFKRRGSDKQITLSQGVEIADIVRKRSVENTCTALRASGSAPDYSKPMWVDGNLWLLIKWSMDMGNTQMVDYPSEQDGYGYHDVGIGFTTDYNAAKPSDKSSYTWTNVSANGVAFPSVAPRMSNGQYVWLAYSMYSDGTGLNADPRGKRYIGWSTHHNSSVMSTNPADYYWAPLPLKDQPEINLRGVQYDDGDIYVDQADGLLKSREGNMKWSRYVTGEGGNGQGYIVRTYSYDTTLPAELLDRSVKKLREFKDETVTFEASLIYLPESVQLGDTVNIVDEWSDIRIRARLLKLERSRASGRIKATFGNYAII